MRITSKGQVTIPQEIRERFGLLPNTEVEFVAKRNSIQIVKSTNPGRLALPYEAAFLAGKAYLIAPG
jgi:AbrB family looped-hinge helix DNA binding protein